MLFLPYYAHLSLLALTSLLVVLLVLRIYIRRIVLFKSDDRLDGKTVVITGGNSGIGQAVAIDLAKRGAKVILACRDRSRRDSAPFAVRTRSGNANVRFMFLNLSSLDSVVEFSRQLVEQESRIDILVNNAAVLCGKGFTADGLDMVMGVNAFGHFLLTNLLLDKMKSTACDGGRIINVVSEAYRRGHLELSTLDLAPVEEHYSMYRAYSNSKLALTILTREMSKRFKVEGISVFAVDPGSVNTKLFRHWPGWSGQVLRTMAKLVFRSPEEGAQTILHCILTRGLEKDSGRFFYNCYPRNLYLREYEGDDQGEMLWDRMQAVLKAKKFPLNLNEYSDD